MERHLFLHQKEALAALNEAYSNKNIKSSGLLVIPTGGGKTFTAISWLKQMAQAYACKIMWLAQSFELLNQASLTFDELLPELKKIVVSSNTEHRRISDIQDTHDIVAITTQTAMAAMKKGGNRLESYLSNNRENLFIVVLDEAHHAPAHGCRTMLTYLKEQLPNIWLLGLTATPTYTDRNRRGWLWKIFDDGIIYEVEKGLLQREKILAKENILSKKTPSRIEISDEDFARLTRYHTDIPENIIEELASNQERNDFIINEYLSKIDFYGKVIIFLDRWYQCLYFREKLMEHQISADAVFYQNDGEENKKIIDRFRRGQIKVLLNVRMMTEGADVPDVKSVFITRETTSHILLHQMIGRALRGERAGGKKDVANIVLFGDTWNKNIAWAKPELDGGIEEDRVFSRSHPVESISQNLLNSLIQSLTFHNIDIPDYLDLIPIGWYLLEYVSFALEGKIEIVKDNVLVYPNEKEIWDGFIIDCIDNLSDDWADEELSFEQVRQKLIRYQSADLKEVKDNGLEKVYALCRHIAQSRVAPTFFSLDARDSMNIEHIAEQAITMNPYEQFQFLQREYASPGSVWNNLYDNFYHFKSTVDLYVNKHLFQNGENEGVSHTFDLPPVASSPQFSQANEKEIVRAVKQRDKNMCVCCGLTSKETKLVVTSIYTFSDATQFSNLQTLCTGCNSINKARHYNFMTNTSSLVRAKKFDGVPFDKKFEKDLNRLKSAIRASVNFFYGCNACHSVKISRRRNSPDYKICKIYVYSSNDISQINVQVQAVKDYITATLGQQHIETVEFIQI